MALDAEAFHIRAACIDVVEVAAVDMVHKVQPNLAVAAALGRTTQMWNTAVENDDRPLVVVLAAEAAVDDAYCIVVVLAVVKAAAEAAMVVEAAAGRHLRLSYALTSPMLDLPAPLSSSDVRQCVECGS